MPSITTAFLGVAHIHTPGFVNQLKELAQSGDVTVKSVWDHDAPRGAATAEKLGASPASSYAGILADPEIEAVVICSETAHHRELGVAAANAGKHVFIEKPLGVGKADAEAIADAVEKAGVVFQTGFVQRGAPVNQFIKNAVRAGHLGTVTRARYSNCHNGAADGYFDSEWKWFVQPELSGGGALLDMGAHALDLIIDTFSQTEGAIVEAHGATANRSGRFGGKVDEYGSGLIEFASGFHAVFEASWVDSASLRAPVSVFGTEGAILVAPEGVFFQSKRVDGADGKTPLASDQMPAGAPHAFRLFWDHLLGRPTQVPLVPVRQAALGSATMERLYETAKR